MSPGSRLRPGSPNSLCCGVTARATLLPAPACPSALPAWALPCRPGLASPPAAPPSSSQHLLAPNLEAPPCSAHYSQGRQVPCFPPSPRPARLQPEAPSASAFPGPPGPRHGLARSDLKASQVSSAQSSPGLPPPWRPRSSPPYAPRPCTATALSPLAALFPPASPLPLSLCSSAQPHGLSPASGPLQELFRPSSSPQPCTFLGAA